MAWTDYRSAPAAGTMICREDAITDAQPVTITTERGSFPLIVVRLGAEWRAYVNACPHQYLPLDYRSDRVVSADGTMLLCSGHGARFDMLTGAAIDGAECGLDAVPIMRAGGVLMIGGAG